MSFDWKTAFTEAEPAWKDAWHFAQPVRLYSLEELKHYLDLVHMKHCLLKPYSELKNYPVVDIRELVPSFESGYCEHKDLPGFSLVAFNRPVVPFTEVFQFDHLAPTHAGLRAETAQQNIKYNREVVESRLPRFAMEQFREKFERNNVASVNNYPAILPFLMEMDRAQVFGMQGEDPRNQYFYLSGIYGSLPCDLDAEVKRYGQRIGKFCFDNHDLYEINRLFVLQHLMELYGFPIASERRTSAALFARRLHKMGERFLIRTLGQTDRTITTLWNDGKHRDYPKVEKIAIVRLEEVDADVLSQLKEEGYLLDAKQRTVLLRVFYRQHKFSQDNVRQERAISIARHEVVHPLTGLGLKEVSVLREASSMFLRLNDIVRGEYSGCIIYKRNELVENTETDEKRLKFLFAWLSKHQRRIIGYSDEFYAKIEKVLDSYLFSIENEDVFNSLSELYKEVVRKYSYIHQARKVRLLEDLAARRGMKGESISYLEMLSESTALLRELKFEIVAYFDSLVSTAISIGDSMLNNRYLVRSYIEKDEDALSESGLEIKRQYGKLVSVIDELKSIRKTRTETKSSTWA